MTFLSARDLCILSMIIGAALVAPDAASASLGAQCSGSNITAQGSSLQKLAQQIVWDGDFNTSGATRACNGSQGTKATPTVTYNSTSSGTGLESWGVNGHVADFEASNAFVSTDEPPGESQTAEIEEHGTAGTLETIPVLQSAVAIIVNLPVGCEGSSKVNAHRIVFNNVTLEKIFRGTITRWSEITDNEDKLSAQTGKTCNPETLIRPVVRKDQSGTTHIFKKYLSLINSGVFQAENTESRTWSEISEGIENTTWPKAANVVRPAFTGGGALITKVSETPSSIGYANLADVRNNKLFSPPAGGPFTSRFWVEIQNNGIETTGTITYAEPSTNGESEAAANANCGGEDYIEEGEEVPFPPPSVLEPWNKVTTQTIEKNYTLCGLTYVLSFTKYSLYTGTNLQEATTANNFLRFVLGTGPEGGQSLIDNNHDYLSLQAGPVLNEAEKGAENIKF